MLGDHVVLGAGAEELGSFGVLSCSEYSKWDMEPYYVCMYLTDTY